MRLCKAVAGVQSLAILMPAEESEPRRPAHHAAKTSTTCPATVCKAMGQSQELTGKRHQRTLPFTKLSSDEVE